jgi:hypothetical protein
MIATVNVSAGPPCTLLTTSAWFQTCLWVLATNDTDLCVFPSAEFYEDMSSAASDKRAVFVFRVYLALLVGGIVWFSLARFVLTYRSGRRPPASSRTFHEYAPVDASSSDEDDCAEDSDRDEEGSRDKMDGNQHWTVPVVPGAHFVYTAADVYFAVYYTVYVLSVVELTFYYVQRGFFRIDAGLYFECALPWLLELYAVHVVIAARSLCLRQSTASMWPLDFTLSLTPFFSERWDMLRDASALAVYAASGAYVSVVLALAAWCLPAALIFADPCKLACLRRDFWPGSEHFRDRSPPTTSWLKIARLRMLREVEKQGREHKQVMILWEGLLQGFAAFLCISEHGFNVIVLVAVAWTILLGSLLHLSRPFVLQQLAKRGAAWSMPCVSDLRRAFPILGASHWRFVSTTAATFVLDLQCPGDVRSEVAETFVSWVRCTWDELQAEPSLFNDFCEMHRQVVKGLIRARNVAQLLTYLKGVPIRIDDRDAAQPAAKDGVWELVAAILMFADGANINFLNISAQNLHGVVEIMEGRDSDTSLKYLNLNDNKKLATEELGVEAIVRLVELSPQLTELRIKNTGASEDSLRLIRGSVQHKPSFNLVVE